MLRGIKDIVKKFFALAPQTLTADALSAACDLKGVLNFGFELVVGAASFTSTDKMVVTIHESDDNVTYTASADVVQLVAAGDASKVHLLEYTGVKRYVKLNLDLQGALTGVPVAVSGLATKLEKYPAE